MHEQGQLSGTATRAEIAAVPGRPMVLMVTDEAAGLLSERSREGDLARWFVEVAVRYGRKAGVGVSISRETVDRLTVFPEVGRVDPLQAAEHPRQAGCAWPGFLRAGHDGLLSGPAAPSVTPRLVPVNGAAPAPPGRRTLWRKQMSGRSTPRRYESRS